MQTRSAAGEAWRPSRRVASRQIQTRSSLRVRIARRGALARAGGDASAAGLGCSHSPVGEMRSWRASEESLPSATRSGGAGRVLSDAEGVEAAALLPTTAASAAGICRSQPMAVLRLVVREWTRAQFPKGYPANRVRAPL